MNTFITQTGHNCTQLGKQLFYQHEPSLAIPVICSWIALSTLGAARWQYFNRNTVTVNTSLPQHKHCWRYSCPQLENRKRSLTPNSCWTVNCSWWHCLFWYFSPWCWCEELYLYLL